MRFLRRRFGTLCADFEAARAEAIERCRLERPDVYIRVIASLLPKQVTEKVDPFDEWSVAVLRSSRNGRTGPSEVPTPMLGHPTVGGAVARHVADAWEWKVITEH